MMAALLAIEAIMFKVIYPSKKQKAASFARRLFVYQVTYVGI